MKYRKPLETAPPVRAGQPEGEDLIATAKDRFPHRVRLHGGRAVHAARDLLGGGRETACEYYLDAEATNDWQPSDTAVTCKKCARLTPTY